MKDWGTGIISLTEDLTIEHGPLGGLYFTEKGDFMLEDTFIYLGHPEIIKMLEWFRREGIIASYIE